MEKIELMEKIIERLQKTYYGDVRYEKGKGMSASKNKSEENINTASSTGMQIRAFSNDKWRYLGFNSLDERKVLPEVDKMVRRAGSKKSHLHLSEPWETDSKIPIKKDGFKIITEEKLKLVQDIYENIISHKKIVNAGVSVGHSTGKTVFMNTEGSFLKQEIPYFRLILNAIAKEEKRVESDYFVLARIGGFELLDNIDINKKVEEVAKDAGDMLSARTVKGGRHDIIVDPDISGVIAHESFGHGCEADQVLRDRSYLSPLKGKKIVSPLITLHDNSALKGERGFFFFDDEGVKSSDTIIVRDGVLEEFMHDRQSAAFMGTKATGNARAQDFSRKVFVRMSNTYIEPKDWKIEELKEDTRKGFYLVKALTGMEDPLGGNLQIMTGKAYEIKNGEIAALYKGVGISGKVLEFLNNVDGITKDFEMKGSGCGKGSEDYVPVSSGGPHMRIREAIIG